MAPRLILLVFLPVIFSTVSFLLLKYWVKMRRESSFLIAMATMLGAAAMAAWRIYQLDRSHGGTPREGPALFILGCSILLIMFAVPLGTKLYRAWTGIQVSPEEQAPGAAGVRAWLSSGNLIVSAIVAGCAAGGYGYQFLGVFALLVGSLLIQPLINTTSASEAAPVPEPSLTAEREKVLSLLETGKITAEESADLLNALWSTSQASAKSAPVSRQRRLALIGAGLVLLGFFLPWFSIDPAKELNRMTGQFFGTPVESFGQLLPKDMAGNRTTSGGRFQPPTIHMSGGDMQKGLGWLVLLLGLGTAALPYATTTMDAATQRMISFIALGIGGIVMFWLISQNLRFINAGAILALAGYAIQFLGLLNPRPQRAGAPVIAEVDH